MHICIFVENTHPKKILGLNVGGISNQILLLLSSYEKINDLRISIVTKYSEFKPISNRINIFQLYKYRNYIIDTLHFIIKSFYVILNIHKKDPIDVINIHTHANIIFSPFLIRLLFKIPILMKIPLDYTSYIRQIELTQKNKLKAKLINFSWFKFFCKFIIRKISWIRILNEKMFEDLLELKYPEKNILKIPNGINSKSYIGIKKIRHKDTHYGYVGRLTEFKNLGFLLKVFKNYLNYYPNDKLFIYGKGSEESSITEFIKTNNISKNIIFSGFEKNKTKIYSNLDVIIDPALGQGLSNTNLEAFCTKTFVIASNVYGNRELIKHRVTGLLFNPVKEEDLLNQLKFYKKNNMLVKQILNNAYEKILQKYDIDTITTSINKFLKKSIIEKKVESKF